MSNNDRYLIISADCHAGLPCEEYRPYLDPKYSVAFEDYLAERHAMRAQRMADSGYCASSASVLWSLVSSASSSSTSLPCSLQYCRTATS